MSEQISEIEDQIKSEMASMSETTKIIEEQILQKADKLALSETVSQIEAQIKAEMNQMKESTTILEEQIQQKAKDAKAKQAAATKEVEEPPAASPVRTRRAKAKG